MSMASHLSHLNLCFHILGFLSQKTNNTPTLILVYTLRSQVYC